MWRNIFFKLHQYYKAMTWVRSTLHKGVSLSLPFNSHPYIFPILVRDGSGYQNRWIFEKLPGGRGHFQSKNFCCRFWAFILGFFQTFSKNILQQNFQKNEGGGSKAVWNFFRKFIHFGRLTCPLPLHRGWQSSFIFTF